MDDKLNEVINEEQKKFDTVVQEQASETNTDIISSGAVNNTNQVYLGTDKSVPENPDLDNQDISEDDLEILKFIEDSAPKIYVIGLGGSGCNTLNRLFTLGIADVTLIAGNTDARHLLNIKAHRKVLLGKKLTRGRGAGSDASVGEAAAKESAPEIQSLLKGSDMVFVTCGLGGGTGSGSIPVVAQIAKESGALTVAVVTLPFKSEGRTRMQRAVDSLNKLRKVADITIVIRNDKLLTIAPDLPLNTAFKVSDEVLAGSVKGIAELVTQVGIVNVDFADLKTAMSNAGYAVIGMGEASSEIKPEKRAIVAVETALNSPLLEADLSTANRALINIIGGDDMTLKEAQTIIEETASRISSNANIKWGARIDKSIKKSTIRVLIVVSGGKFPKYDEVDKLFEQEEEELPDLDLDLLS